MNHGFIKVAAAVPPVSVADCRQNVKEMIALAEKASMQGVVWMAFPELCITGYTCGDLFTQNLLLEEAENALAYFVEATAQYNMVCVTGLPVRCDNQIFNCAAVSSHGRIWGVVPKSFIPGYKEFYEERWFADAANAFSTTVTLCNRQVPFGTKQLFVTGNAKIAIELCEDLWVPIPPSSQHVLGGANIIINLSASDELIGKHNYLHSLVAQQSARCITGYVYASAGFGESSTDLVFAGNGLIYENGSQLAATPRFTMQPQLAVSDIDIERLMNERQMTSSFMEHSAAQRQGEAYHEIAIPIVVNNVIELDRKIDPMPFMPASTDKLDRRCDEILEIQAAGLIKRVLHTHAQTLVIGISGGLDSTLALLVCARAMQRLQRPLSDIIGITMPGFGTSGRTYHNAIDLMNELGITTREISIVPSVKQHLSDIGHDINNHDATYENAQARERTQILMDIANQTGGLVIGTGDMSELALGWATYNGDHMSMYAVSAGVPKTLVKSLVEHASRDESYSPTMQALLHDVVNTPISPELTPADENDNIQQKTEDLVGPYELHDFFLYYTLRHGFRPSKIYFLACKAFDGKYDGNTIKHWLRSFYRRFFSQQFKRSCLPDGPKVGSVSLSPRGDWRMPSDAAATMWLAECDSLTASDEN